MGQEDPSTKHKRTSEAYKTYLNGVWQTKVCLLLDKHHILRQTRRLRWLAVVKNASNSLFSVEMLRPFGSRPEADNFLVVAWLWCTNSTYQPAGLWCTNKQTLTARGDAIYQHDDDKLNACSFILNQQHNTGHRFLFQCTRVTASWSNPQGSQLPGPIHTWKFMTFRVT